MDIITNLLNLLKWLVPILIVGSILLPQVVRILREVVRSKDAWDLSGACCAGPTPAGPIGHAGPQQK